MLNALLASDHCDMVLAVAGSSAQFQPEVAIEPLVEADQHGKTLADAAGSVQRGVEVGIGRAHLAADPLALVLGLVRDAGLGEIDPLTGLLAGLVVGIAVAAASLPHRLFAGHGIRVWALEIGNDLLNFALMGLILSAWY